MNELLTSLVHMQVLNVAQLTTTFRRDMTLCSLSRVSVEHIVSSSLTEFHLAVVSCDLSPTSTRHQVHRRQRTYSSVHHCLILSRSTSRFNSRVIHKCACHVHNVVGYTSISLHGFLKGTYQVC